MINLRFNDAEIKALLDRIDGSSSNDAWDARLRLRELLDDDLPSQLLARYCSQKHWRARHDYVYDALGYARRSEDSVTLGRLGTGRQDTVSLVAQHVGVG